MTQRIKATQHLPAGVPSWPAAAWVVELLQPVSDPRCLRRPRLRLPTLSRPGSNLECPCTACRRGISLVHLLQGARLCWPAPQNWLAWPTLYSTVMLRGWMAVGWHAVQVKYLLLGHNILPEGVAAHLVASLLAGLAVATTTNPVSIEQPVSPSPQLQINCGVDFGLRTAAAACGGAWLRALVACMSCAQAFQAKAQAARDPRLARWLGQMP